ncbi:hypothetical protein HOF65_03015 [bacterium]|nr:hypothetical protein [bacterium]MBT3852967.1 hypothetical protein [bacterium]MBT4633252.1 hypothetical protein [bacterium]MBT5491997.1 hypothetical protein [bacterium]MBT6779010.1 hypothetical protein [bacterium]
MSAANLVELISVCSSIRVSALFCNFGSRVVYIFNQPTLTISFQYFSSKYSLTKNTKWAEFIFSLD